MTLHEWLKDQGACDEALAWVEAQSAEQAWSRCTIPDWMVWVLDRLNLSPACNCFDFSKPKPPGPCPLRVLERMTADQLREAYPFARIRAALSAEVI